MTSYCRAGDPDDSGAFGRAWRHRARWRSVAMVSTLALAGCGGGGPESPEAMNRSYEQALARTASVAVELPAGEATTAVFDRLQGFFATVSADAIRAKAEALYAPDAYLNDNLAVVEGSAAVGNYFAHTASRVRALKVEMLDVTHRGPDYFARWRMTVDSPKIRADAPLVSYGMSHFRFDRDGRVLLHKDFWDAGTGLYEYLPVVGWIVRNVRAAADRP